MARSSQVADGKVVDAQVDDEPRGRHTSSLDDDPADSDLDGAREVVNKTCGTGLENRNEPGQLEDDQDLPDQDQQDPRLDRTDDQATRTGQERYGLRTISTTSWEQDFFAEDDVREPSSPDSTDDDLEGEDAPNGLLPEVTFEKVYHNTLHTDDKRKIVEWPGRSNDYYTISPCDICPGPRTWGYSTIKAACSHLKGSKHKSKTGTTTDIIRMFGIRVTNCTRKLQEKNNKAYKEALERAGFVPLHKLTLAQKKAVMQNFNWEAVQSGADLAPYDGADDQESIDSGEHTDEYSEGIEDIPPEQVITNPVPGEVYQVFWKDSEPNKTGWYFVTPLPMPPKDFREVGMSSMCSLFKFQYFSGGANIPKCYRKSGPSYTWAEGFEDDGPRMTKRQIPILFLDPGLDIPPAGQEFHLPEHMDLIGCVGVRSLRLEHFKIPDDRQPRWTGAGGRAVAEAFKARLRDLGRGQHIAGQPEESSVSFPLGLREHAISKC